MILMRTKINQTISSRQCSVYKLSTYLTGETEFGPLHNYGLKCQTENILQHTRKSENLFYSSLSEEF